jgi:hypothetical protein
MSAASLSRSIPPGRVSSWWAPGAISSMAPQGTPPGGRRRPPIPYGTDEGAAVGVAVGEGSDTPPAVSS